MAGAFDVTQVTANMAIIRRIVADRADSALTARAIKAGAGVIAEAMAERAPTLDSRTTNSSALEPGALKADIGVRMKSGATQPTALAGPTLNTAHVAYWVEYGHRDVHGGQSKLGKSGKYIGNGKEGALDVPQHPFLRPAYEASEREALEIVGTTIRQGLKGA